MPPSQLKIMFKTSDPSGSNDYVVLTSAMLGYTGKMKLETYPIFDPSVKFNDELRRKIQDMSYKKKIELFFNVKTYERKITNSPEMIITKKKKVQEKGIEKALTKAETKAASDRDIADTNFEFMIQCIFCTGLPVANYYKTMEFYDPKHTARKVTLKGTKSMFDFIMPTRFERCFSYLKLNGQVYTVTGLTWINDVLNHPVYVDILTKYKLYKTDVDNVNSEKNDTELENKLNNLFIDIHDFGEIWGENDKVDTNYYNRYSSTHYLESKKMRDKLKNIFNTIKEDKDDSFLNIDVNKTEVKKFISFGAIKKALGKEEENKKHKLKELILQYSATIKTTNDLLSLNDIVDSFNKNPAMEKLRKEIKRIVTGYTEEEMRNFVRGTTYESSFMKYFRTLHKLFTKDDMYKIIKNDLNYQDRTPNEIKEMDTLIENELKNYYEYRKSLRDIDSDREISNIHWKKEAESVNGITDLTLNDEVDAPAKSLFEVVSKCKEKNTSCVSSKTALAYLDLGVERINKRDPKIFTYEAYINLEVVEGVYNDLNYQKLLCPYMSNVLGDAYEQMNKVENKGENDVMQNRVFLKASPGAMNAIVDPNAANAIVDPKIVDPKIADPKIADPNATNVIVANPTKDKKKKTGGRHTVKRNKKRGRRVTKNKK